jgi:putative endonuclease
MAKHNLIGTNGEQIAADFLENKGYRILCKNWRAGKKEIDIVADDKGVLVIADIKTRSSYDFAFPEEMVDKRKQQNLKAAAAVYADENRQYRDIRYDVVSILMEAGSPKEIVHFQEAFY